MKPETFMKYTNGTGHLIMSVLTLIVGLCLVLFTNDGTIRGLGVSLIISVHGAWFISGAAKQVAHEVGKQLNKGGVTDGISTDSER